MIMKFVEFDGSTNFHHDRPSVSGRNLHKDGGGGTQRCRLSGDVMELWHLHRTKPTHMELHRPWAYLFRFAGDVDSTEHFYAEGFTIACGMRQA